jgi:hypothetical protein
LIHELNRQPNLSAFIAFFPCIHSETACLTQRTKKKAQAQKVEFQTVQKKALAPFEGLCFYLTFGADIDMILEQIKIILQ